MEQVSLPFGRILIALGLAALALAPLSSAQPGLGGDPDLVITDVQIAPDSPQPGEEATITLTIANRGDADVKRNTGFGVEFLTSLGPKELSNLGLGVLTGIRIGKTTVRAEIPAGESVNVDFRWNVIQLPKLDLIFKVDSPFDEVAESNEGNNRFETSFLLEQSALDEWWLDQVNAQGAWATTRGSTDVTVAVIDSGVDINHTEFRDNLWAHPDDGSHGFDFVDDRLPSKRRTVFNFHGTSVAGLIAARDDGQGVTGVAPHVQLMDLRVLRSVQRGGRAVGAFTFQGEDIVAAINFAAAHGADVINLSLGGGCNQPTASERSAIRNATSHGAVVVISAGNNGRCVTRPASTPEAIAVGATTKAGEIAPFSSRGPEVWVSAPGGAFGFATLINKFAELLLTDFQAFIPQANQLLISTYLRDNYGWFNGTSAAAPIVSGVVALMKSVDPGITPQQVRSVLAATAQDAGKPGHDENFGHGIVDAQAAVECVVNDLSCTF